MTRPPVLGYDALGRLHTVTGAVEAARLLWDGDSLAGEYDTGSGSFTQHDNTGTAYLFTVIQHRCKLRDAAAGAGV